MLEIRTGQGNMVLDSKTKIRFSYLFPLFVTDAIPSMVTYSFDLPDDIGGINASYLLASPYFDSAKKYRKVSATIIFAGYESDSGVIICTGYANRKFRCTFLSTIFADGFADFDMQTVGEIMPPITMGETTAQIVAQAKALSQSSYPSSDVCFPMIYAPDFYGDANTDFQQILNWYKDSQYVVNQITRVWQTGDPEEGDYETNENSLLPCFYVRSIIKHIFSSQGFAVKGNFFSNPVSKGVVMLSTKAADRFDPLWNFEGTLTDYHDELQVRILTFGEHTIGQGFTFDAANGKVIDSSAKGYYDVVGENLKFQYLSGARNLSVNVFWSSISGTVNVAQVDVASPDDVVTVDSIIGSFYIETEGQIGIFIGCTQNYQPIGGTVSIKGASKNTLNRFAKTISLGHSFSGTRIGEMVDAIRSAFGLLFFVDKQRQVVEVDLAANVIENSRPTDITTTIVSDPEKQYPDSKQFTVNYSWDDEELMTPLASSVGAIALSNPFGLPVPRKNVLLKIANLYRYMHAVKLDDGSYVWDDHVTFLSAITVGGIVPDEYLIAAQTLVSHYCGSQIVLPYLPGEGRSEVFGNDSDMKLTLLSYHGFASTDATGAGYPCATAGNLANNGSPIPGVQSLLLSDNNPNNLYHKAIKPMLNVVGNHEEITVDIHPSLDNVMRLLALFRPSAENEEHPARKVIVQGAEMFIKQFDFEVTLHGITAAQLKLAKRNYEF